MHALLGVLSGALLACLLISCAQQPAYYVDSYDELQAEFADYPQFRFPDKDLCDESLEHAGGYLISYSIEENGCARSRRLIEYGFEAKFYSLSDGSAPVEFWMQVRDRISLKSGRPPIEFDEVEPTMWRSGVGIEVSRELWEPNEASDNVPSLWILYSFDIDGVNYGIRGNVPLPTGSPDDPAAKETIAEVELLLLEFVDSTIENE